MELSDFLDQIDMTDLNDAQREAKRKAICVGLGFGAEIHEVLDGKQVLAYLRSGWLIVEEVTNDETLPAS